MSETQAVPPMLNRTMKFVLRSPVHGIVSKTILLITFTGRKSGKTYTTPVSYSRDGDHLYIFTHANWWKNLQRGAPVTLRLQGREVQGMAETIATDKSAIAAQLAVHLRDVPFDAKFYGVTLDANGNPDPSEVAKAAETVVMIRIQLC